MSLVNNLYEEDLELYNEYVRHKSTTERAIELISLDIERQERDIKDFEQLLEEEHDQSIADDLNVMRNDKKNLEQKLKTTKNDKSLKMIESTIRSKTVEHLPTVLEVDKDKYPEIVEFYHFLMKIFDITEVELKVQEREKPIEVAPSDEKIPFKEINWAKYAIGSKSEKYDLTGKRIFTIRVERVRQDPQGTEVKIANRNKPRLSRDMFGTNSKRN